MTVGREVAVSAGLSLVATAAIAVGGLWAARSAATAEAVYQAEQATELLARAVIEPAIGEGLVDGDPAAIEALDVVVQTSVIGEQVLTVRVWAADGTVLYTDDLAGIGQQFPLEPDEEEVLATGESHAELSDLSKEENADQTDFDELLEVYVAIEDPNGTPLLFETYQSTAGISATTRRIAAAFLPVVLGGLLLLGLVQALLSWRLARRLQRTRDERERLLAQALAASDYERRTIAADLHDGVVQDLVGLTYALDAMAIDATPERAAGLTAAAGTTRGSVRSLRSLLVEIYPPNLDQVGLAGAVADLASAAQGPGLVVDVSIDPELVLPAASQAAAYRTIREALSNVRRHADASFVAIVVSSPEPAIAEVRVTDNGRGFDPSAVETGHVGLRLLADLAASADGALTVDSAPGAGTTIVLRVPR